ncbi:MAG TPA: T9SS type A sorting domain-containing protein, partial [Chitinophagaceae bacterium]
TDNAADLAVDALGNVYVTGFSSSGSGSFADYVTIKYNTTGTQQWLISYNGTANDGDQATAIAVDNLGNAYVTGGSVSVAPGANYDYATIKYSPPLVVNAGSDITVNFGFGSNCTHLTATASGGSLPYRYAWVPGGSDPAGQSTIVCPTKTTSYVVTVTDANNNTAADEVVVNVTDVRCGADSTKVIICHKGQSLCVSASAVKVHLQHGDQLGNCPEIRTTSQSNKISTEFTAGLSLSNYPNPFSTETKIVYFLPFDSKVSLKVYDVTGKEIAILVQWPQKAGTYSFDFKSAGFSKGVYYYRITAASGKQYLDITKKMMIVK